MKHASLLVVVILLAISNSAVAEFFEGFNNGSTAGQSTGTAQAQTNTDAQGYGTGASEVNGQGTAQGNAGGEVNFAVTFKGKGSTYMATDAYGSGQGNTNANLYSYTDATATATGYNNLYGYGNSYGITGYNYPSYGASYYGYNPMIMDYGYPMITQAPSFDQIQQQMRAAASVVPTK